MLYTKFIQIAFAIGFVGAIYDTRNILSRDGISIITRQKDCLDCIKAILLLKANHVPFDQLNARDLQVKEFLTTNDIKRLPAIFEKGKFIRVHNF